MSVLNFVDRYSSTLASSYTSGGGSLSVSSATGLPTGTVNFFVIVQAEGGNTEEVFLVTNVSGTTLTVTGAQAGTSASNHASGATIIGSIMTVSAFKQVGPVLVEEQTASSSSTLDFTVGISSDYDTYLFQIVNLVPNTNAIELDMRMSTDGGSTYDSGTNYESSVFAWDFTGTQVAGGTSRTSLLLNLRNSTTANWSINGHIYLYNPGGAIFKIVKGYVETFDSSNSKITNWIGSGAYKITTAVNAIRFLPTSGNFASGSIRMYGLAK